MIFGASDRDAIFRSQVRKACESSAMITHPEIPRVKAQMIQKHLLVEVARCGHMIRIADNDLSQVRQAVRVLDHDPINLPLDVYQEYLGMMDTKTQANEGYFMFLYSYMLSNLDHLREGIKIADMIIEGDNPVSYKETIRLAKIRGIYERLADYCRDKLDVEDVPYREALEYIECALEEISIILRVATGKDVEIEEISDHMELSENLDPTAFRNLFMIDMDPEELHLVESFEVDFDRRTEIMFG